MIETAMVPVEDFASEDVMNIFNLYAEYLGQRYGLTREALLSTGYQGGQLFDMELAVLGNKAYETSVFQAIRNLYYATCVMDNRANTLDEMTLDEPILDYGGGIGFMALYLKRRGYEDVWVYEPPGTQEVMFKDFLVEQGVQWGIPRNPGTVFCINVLEHMDEPRRLLTHLRSLGGQLYANCDTHEGAGHVAPAQERQAVIDDLISRGQFLDFTAGVADA